MHSNRKWIAAVAVIVVVGVVAALASGAFSSRVGPGVAPRATTRAPHRHTLRPVYDPPNQANSTTSSAQQQAENTRIAEAAPSPAQWALVEALKLPAPATSAQFPAIPHATRQNPDSYATAFVSELLGIDFAKESRGLLLSWAVSETSPETMPGTPASVAGKFLYYTLTASGSPIPSATRWAANAATGVIWSVSDVTMTSPPTWSQALATGWQPPDLRMDFLDVTGDLNVSQPGRPSAVKPFSLLLGLGTAKYHHGYGAMSVNNWRVG